MPADGIREYLLRKKPKQVAVVWHDGTHTENLDLVEALDNAIAIAGPNDHVNLIPFHSIKTLVVI